MPQPTSYQDKEAISDLVDNECEAAVGNSDTEIGTRDKPAKRLYQWEATDDDTEDLNQDGYQLVQSKKKSKNSLRAQELTEMDREDSNITQTTYRLSFPAARQNDVAGRCSEQTPQPLRTSQTDVQVNHGNDEILRYHEVFDGDWSFLQRQNYNTHENHARKQNDQSVYQKLPHVSGHEFYQRPSISNMGREKPSTRLKGTKEASHCHVGGRSSSVLPEIRFCKIERYVDKPAFCGNCQKWENRVWGCDGIKTCGFCCQHHNTSVCKEKIQTGEQLEHKCPNCSQEHKAWSFKCPMRSRISLDPREEIIT